MILFYFFYDNITQVSWSNVLSFYYIRLYVYLQNAFVPICHPGGTSIVHYRPATQMGNFFKNNFLTYGFAFRKEFQYMDSEIIKISKDMNCF